MVDEMKEIRWEIIKHSEIDELTLTEIAMIKDQYWKHGVESQLIWINNNIREDDYHLCGFLNRKMVAYMAIIEGNVEIDSQRSSFLGLSNVCVSNEVRRKGIGSELMLQANRFISKQEKAGLLLCKDSLVPFYQKNSWSLMSYQNAIVGDGPYDKIIMFYSCSKGNTVKSIQIERNF